MFKRKPEPEPDIVDRISEALAGILWRDLLDDGVNLSRLNSILRRELTPKLPDLESYSAVSGKTVRWFETGIEDERDAIAVNVGRAMKTVTQASLSEAGMLWDRAREIAAGKGDTPSSLELAQVATAAGCTVEDLLFGDDKVARIAYLERCREDLIAYKSDLKSRLDAAQATAGPCENYSSSSSSTCLDDPARSFDADYSADRYCLPCRISHIVNRSPAPANKEN